MPCELDVYVLDNNGLTARREPPPPAPCHRTSTLWSERNPSYNGVDKKSYVSDTAVGLQGKRKESSLH